MKLKTLLRLSLCATLLAIFLTSCIQDQVSVTSVHYTDQEIRVLEQTLDLPQERDSYRVHLAEHMLKNNAFPPAINDAKATLGRVLFYDTKLSATGETSCASCHDQALAFSDDKALSDGINGQQTKRNSLPLASAANFVSSYDNPGPSFAGNIGFFWDERAHSIAQQSAMTIQDDIEMGMDLDELAAKLAQEEYYSILFSKAFGDEFIDGSRITDALQEFVNSFVSVNSPFDDGLNKAGHVSDEFPNYTDQENRGKLLFIDNCSSCHAADMTTPTGLTVANNGLDLEYEDNGMGDFTNIVEHNGVFKVPFLRNIALTGPYMHDGRFETLEEVIEHYSSGIQAHDNLSAPLRDGFNGNPIQFNFTEDDKDALMAFLHTLTDDQFVEAQRFSDPFK